MSQLFVVYHRAPEIFNEAFDGLFVVAADDESESIQTVKNKMLEAFNDAIAEPLGAVKESKIVLEFWRQVPKPSPRIRDNLEVAEV